MRSRVDIFSATEDIAGASQIDGLGKIEGGGVLSLDRLRMVIPSSQQALPPLGINGIPRCRHVAYILPIPAKCWHYHVNEAIHPVDVGLKVDASIDVVISYAHEERALASTLSEQASSNGASVWWDCELVAGDDFDAAILASLK